MDQGLATHSAVRTWGPFTGRQLTTIICVVAVMILFPVGASAVTGNNVFLTDASSGNSANVTNGRLQVDPRAGNQSRFLVSVSASHYLPIGAFGLDTDKAITDVTVANRASTDNEVIIASILRLKGKTATCTQMLTTTKYNNQFVAGPTYLRVEVGPHNTVTQDFANGGIDLNDAGALGNDLICPYVYERYSYNQAADVTVIMNT